jgi:hypothetical protein
MPRSTTYNKTSSKKTQLTNTQTLSQNVIKRYKDKLKEWKNIELQYGSRDADINQISKKLVDSFKSNDENKEIDLTGLKFIDLPTKNILKIKNLKIIRINGSDESHQLQELKDAGITIEYSDDISSEKNIQDNTSYDFSEIEATAEEAEEYDDPKINQDKNFLAEDKKDPQEDNEDQQKQVAELKIDSQQESEESLHVNEIEESHKKSFIDKNFLAEDKKDPQEDNEDQQKQEAELKIDSQQESEESLHVNEIEESDKKSFISKLTDFAEAIDTEFLSADEIDFLHNSTIKLSENNDDTPISSIIQLMEIITENFIEALSDKEEKKVLSKDIIMIIFSIIDKENDEDFLSKANKIISDKIHSFSDDKIVEIIFKLKDLCNTKKPEDFSRLDGIGIVSYIRRKIIFEGLVELAEKIFIETEGKETQEGYFEKYSSTQSSENVNPNDKCIQTFSEQIYHDKIMANTLSYAGVIIGNSLDLGGNILNLNMASIYPKQDESLLFLDKVKSKLEKFSDEIKDESLPNFLIEIIAKDAYKEHEKDMKFSEIISQDFVKKLKDKIEEVALPIFSVIKFEEQDPKKAEAIKQQILDCKITELSKLLKLQLKKMEKLATLDIDEKIIETLTNNLQKSFDDIKFQSGRDEIKPSSKLHNKKSQSLLTQLKKCLGKT